MLCYHLTFGFDGTVNTAKKEDEGISCLLWKVFVEQPLALPGSAKKYTVCFHALDIKGKKRRMIDLKILEEYHD